MIGVGVSVGVGVCAIGIALGVHDARNTIRVMSMDIVAVVGAVDNVDRFVFLMVSLSKVIHRGAVDNFL